MATRSENPCILQANFNYSLSLLSHRAVTAITERSPHDFKENEAAARLLGAHGCYVITALYCLYRVLSRLSVSVPSFRSNVDWCVFWKYYVMYVCMYVYSDPKLSMITLIVK